MSGHSMLVRPIGKWYMCRAIWLICLIGSILTSKALMMGEMMDSPISLLCTQTLLVSFFATIQTATQGSRADTLPPVPLGRGKTSLTTAWCLIQCITDVACLIVGYKVLRFSGSLPASAMILSSPGGQAVWVMNKGRLPGNALRGFLLICGFALVVLWDFRLNVTSRDMSIAWLVLTMMGASISGRHLPGLLRPRATFERFSLWPACLLLPIGTVAYLGEGLQVFSRVLEPQTACLLVLNLLLTSALWFLHDGPPPDMESSARSTQTSESWSELPAHDGWTSLLFVASISLGSWLVPGYQVFVSPVQCFGYLVAAAACSGITGDTIVSSVRTSWHNISQPGVCHNELNPPRDRANPASLDLSDSLSSTEVLEGNYTVLRRIVIGTTVAVWVLLTLSLASLGPGSSAQASTRLDRAYNASAKVDVIVAAYERPVTGIMNDLNGLLNLSPLRGETTRVFLYDKGAHLLRSYEDLRKGLGDNTELIISQLENNGREGGTYLHHIIAHWNDLGKHSLFIQEHAHDLRWMKQRIADNFVEETGFMSLSYQGKLWNTCGDVRSRSWPGFARAVTRTLRTIRVDTECHDLVLTYRGQFLASAARIRGNTKLLYEQLLDGLLDLNSWMHQPEYIERGLTAGEPDSLADPAFGYVLERLWGEILGCFGDRIAYRSPSMLSSYVRSVWFGQNFPLADVQCLDKPE